MGLRADLREGSYYSQYYAQTWNGYFTAPVTGNYTFRGNSDDIFQFYLASNYGSTELPTSSLINSTEYQLMDDLYTRDIYSTEATVTLSAGQSYYF